MASKNSLGDQPIEPQYIEQMKAIGRVIDEGFNGPLKGKARKTGFILMVFPMDEVDGEGRCNYLSNADRRDVTIMLREQLARFEGQPDARGKA